MFTIKKVSTNLFVHLSKSFPNWEETIDEVSEPKNYIYFDVSGGEIKATTYDVSKEIELAVHNKKNAQSIQVLTCKGNILESDLIIGADGQNGIYPNITSVDGTNHLKYKYYFVYRLFYIAQLYRHPIHSYWYTH